MSATATTHAARDHARAQAGARAEAMPIVPAPDGAVWAETVAGGGYASKVLARGTTLRLTDVAGDACAHVMLYHADQPWERLNVADTVKVPWQAYLSTGHPLLSDQGRVLATIVDDTSAHHDALCGAPGARRQMVVGAAKHGLGPRDVAPTVAFFEGVRVEPDGTLAFAGSAGPGRHVELRAELPLVVLVANAAHPLDPRAGHTCTTLEIRAWRGAPTAPDDPLWTSTPEHERAFLNTADYAGARGI
jgi:uncharacterized protein YcgI (DUF1989 family)